MQRTLITYFWTPFLLLILLAQRVRSRLFNVLHKLVSYLLTSPFRAYCINPTETGNQKNLSLC